MEKILVHYNAVYRLALKLTMDPDVAADLTQEVFLRAFRFRGHYTEQGQARSWLYIILRRLNVNRIRDEHRTPEMVRDVELPTAAKGADLSSELQEALNNLKDKLRTPLLLATLEGWEYGEIAEFLDIPIGTVRSRINRAKATLRETLTGRRERQAA